MATCGAVRYVRKCLLIRKVSDVSGIIKYTSLTNHKVHNEAKNNAWDNTVGYQVTANLRKKINGCAIISTRRFVSVKNNICDKISILILTINVIPRSFVISSLKLLMLQTYVTYRNAVLQNF